MSGACDGLRVIDFSFWMAGPLATMVLADNGAEVIKIEPPEGDPARDLPAFQTWNRGKKSVVLDLKTHDGQEQANRLLRTADVVVVAFRPGVAERLGIGYEQVREINPGIVYASISGYGEQGSPQQFSAHTLSLGPWEPVGGHTRPILSELGYSDQEIDRLIEERVVEAWSPGEA